ncbi:hypothetical protein [Fischerella thermalis]
MTNYQLPITNYQLPITNYQLPVYNGMSHAKSRYITTNRTKLRTISRSN